MTEIQSQTVETTDVVKSQKKALSGTLSNIERIALDSGPIVFARLTTPYMGRENVRTLSISGDALARVEDLLVEGANVRLYGEEGPTYVTVIGRDLTKRTLAREASKSASAAPVGVKLSKTGRPYTDKELANHKAYGERMAKARADAAARRAAETGIEA